MQEPKLAEPALAGFVAGRCHPHDRQPGRVQPRQRVAVQPPGAGGDDRGLRLTGGSHRQQVAQVVAAVHHLRRDLPRLARLHQRGLPGRPSPRRHQPQLHLLTALPIRPGEPVPGDAVPGGPVPGGAVSGAPVSSVPVSGGPRQPDRHPSSVPGRSRTRGCRSAGLRPRPDQARDPAP
jgi:hypothetical protein